MDWFDLKLVITAGEIMNGKIINLKDLIMLNLMMVLFELPLAKQDQGNEWVTTPQRALIVENHFYMEELKFELKCLNIKVLASGLRSGCWAKIYLSLAGLSVVKLI